MATQQHSGGRTQPLNGGFWGAGRLFPAILSLVTDDEALRLRRELADAKVEQLQARLAEIHATYPDLTTSTAQSAVQQAQAQVADVQAGHPEMTAATQDVLRMVQARLSAAQAGQGSAVVMAPMTGSPLASQEAQASLRQLLGQFGMAGYAAAPDSSGSPAVAASPDLPLSLPPRHVPATYRLLLLPWSTWTAFTLLMVGVAPIAVWLFLPLAAIPVAVVGFLVVVGLALRRYVRLMGILRWGQVATAVEAVPVSVGTYFSGTTYSNMRVPVAHGWQVARQFYSGPGTKTRIRYQLGGEQGELTLRGRGYTDGIILVDSRKPSRALCVSSIPFDLAERTPSGDWTGHLRVGTVIGAVTMPVVVLGWTAVMLLLGANSSPVG